MKTLHQLGDQGIFSCFILLFKGYRKLHSLGMWYSPPRMQSRRTICLGGKDVFEERIHQFPEALPTPISCPFRGVLHHTWRVRLGKNPNTWTFKQQIFATKQCQAGHPSKCWWFFFRESGPRGLGNGVGVSCPKENPCGDLLNFTGHYGAGLCRVGRALGYNQSLDRIRCLESNLHGDLGGVLRSFILLAKRANLTKNFWGLHIRKNQV